MLSKAAAPALGAAVDDRITVAVPIDCGEQTPAADCPPAVGQGEVSVRRLEVTGLLRTGNSEVDDRVAYVRRETLTGMLGTDGPNEVVVLLSDIRHLDSTVARAREALAGTAGAGVHTWAERNPSLQSLVEMGAGGNDMVYVVLFLLIALGVINAVYMSVLERTKELGVMLALGTRRTRLFRLVMTEVGLLGLLSVGLGTALGVGVEIFGRAHGWPMEWFGYEEIQSASVAGVSYETIYYSALSVEKGVAIVTTMFVMLLLAGLLPALRASRLPPVDAMRTE